ncbi:MAG: hypothetical protein ABSA17_00540 [Rhabdochlamydiaceae bacterium]|jgi:hypothetical protein
MDGDKKEGVSVKEIEAFAKKHRFEVFFCLMFLLACIFGVVGMFKSGWSILFGMGGAALGLIFPVKVDGILKTVFHSIFKQDKTLLIIFAVVALLLACLVPFLIFLIVGAAGGRAIHQMASGTSAH